MEPYATTKKIMGTFLVFDEGISAVVVEFKLSTVALYYAVAGTDRDASEALDQQEDHGLLRGTGAHPHRLHL